MISHYIYLISGRKIGCTKNLEDRKLLYLQIEGNIPEIEVLVELHDKTDQEAGDIEWQWADALGYKRGAHYTISGYFNIPPGILRVRSQRSGRRLVESGKQRRFTKEERIENGRKGGRRTAELGLSGFKTQTFEERSERQRRTGKKMAAEKNTPAFRQVKCPHCGLAGNEMIMKRWHFDKCRSRLQQVEP